MDMKVWEIHAAQLHGEQADQSLREIAHALKSGEVIGMPTETVYGLAADATNDAAIEKVFHAKGRPADNPLIVHIHNVNQLDTFVSHIDDKVRVLMDALWPGPISFILPLVEGVISERATVGLKTVAVRMPSHPVAQAVLECVDVPIAAPSANTSGKPSPTEAAHVKKDLEGKIYGVIESDASFVGLESTVLDCTTFPYRIFRPGGVTKQQIEMILNEAILTDITESERPSSPGMKYQHYAPHQRVNVVENWEVASSLPPNVGVIAPQAMKRYVDDSVYFIALCETEMDYEEAARNLYRALREMDNSDVEEIYIHGFTKNDASAALNNRIYRAAGNRIIEG